MDVMVKSGEFVSIGFDGSREVYITGCVLCGGQIKTMRRRINPPYKCSECRAHEKENSDIEILRNELHRLTKLKRLEDTKQLIIKQGHGIEKYKKAITVISKYFDRKNWFQSIPEMATGLELIRCKIRFNTQIKVGKYRVDFILPDQKVALEIDSFYHYLNMEIEEKDEVKDALVLAALGLGWEYVHIEDKLLKTNIRGLIPELKRIKDKLKSLRECNNGQLPKYYRYRD
jgi:very-short-patch-repair endonuclease